MDELITEEITSVGQLILERYKILEELASTKFSTVYKAFDSKMQRVVAIKKIESASKATTWAKREAQLSAQLNHPNICTIYEYEEVPEGHFLIMEYLEGLTLREILDVYDTLSLNEAIAIAREVCLALEYAHLNYIIHKDIKPENIMLLPDGRLKIMDFGTGRLLGHMREAQKTLIGTPAYMSPEQTKKERLDDRCDQFSMAVVLFECLSGASPFEAPSAKAAIFKVQNASVPDLVKLNPEVSQELADVVEKALSKDPDERYSTVTEFRYKLERAFWVDTDSKKVLSSLVERCTGLVEEGSQDTSQPVPVGKVKDFTGRLYLKNTRLINRLLSASFVSGLGFILFRDIAESYSLVLLLALAGTTLFFPSFGLLGLGVVALAALTLKGFLWPAAVLLCLGLLWHVLGRKNWRFELSFSLAASLLAFFQLQVLFPVVVALAFSPLKAFFIALAGALQVLIFQAFWQGKISALSDAISLSQLIIWPVTSALASFILTRKTLPKAVIVSSAAFFVLITAYLAIGASLNISPDWALKSASLSFIITMLVLPLIPYDYLDGHS